MKLAPPTARLLRRVALPLAALGVLASRAPAQTNFTWNNTGTNWQSTASWTPNAVPTSLDAALFRQAGSATGTVATGPSISGSVAALSQTTGLNQNFGGWNFTGAGTLTLGGAGSQGLVISGPQTTVFNGPALAGAGSGSSALNIIVQNGSTLVLSGTTAGSNLATAVSALGGTIRLDNTATHVASRLGTATVTVGGGGALELLGNAAGGTSTVGLLDVANVLGGVNAIRVTASSSSAATVLQFANGAGGSFSSKPGFRAVFSYEATAGNLGAANGAQVRFSATPFTGTNGLLSSLSNTASVGFAIVKDAGGTDFATYGGIGGTGVNRGVANVTPTDAAGLTTLTTTSRAQFNPAAASMTATIGAVTTGSLRITPAGAGATLALGTNNLATNALMLDGPNNFAITGTGTFGAGVNTHYVYVNDSSATLSTSLLVASGSSATVFAGPGFVDLTALAAQNTLSPTGRFVIAGGTVRANALQVGFTNLGPGVVSLSGGVLEIKGGSNLTGALADFTRPVGGLAGNVSWGGNNAGEVGSGGFSAFGAASVNLGGATTPTALQWNATDFVANGFALKFGSTQSNAVLTWLNPIQLDNGTARTAREFNVTAGAGGDRTVLAGVVSGTSTADFLKTGTGNLVLGAANTYTGSTLVHGGTLTLGATNAIATASPIFLGNATLSTGFAGGFSANLGALSLTTGTPTVALGTGSHVLSFTTLSVNVPGLTVIGFTGTAGASGTGGRIVFTGLGSSNASANATFASFLASTSFSGYALGATFLSSGASLELVPAPVPEPGTALGLAALGLAATRLARRRRAKTPHS